jgi:signal transduction histidine kinase
MKRVLQPLLALLTACLSCGTALAQELTRVEQVLALAPLEAGRNPLPVRLSGTVLDVSTELKTFSVHDGSHSIATSFPAATIFPAIGDTVEIAGLTQTSIIAGIPHPRVTVQSLRITGHGPLPQPKKLSTFEVNTFQHYDQWISLEGHVVRWKFRRTDNELVIAIVDAHGFTTVSVRTPGRESVPPALMGAKVRFTGLNYAKKSQSAYGSTTVPSLNQMEILTPGSEDPFAAPSVQIGQITQGKTGPGSRVKVRGVVLANVSQSVIYLRDGDAALCGVLFPPWGNNLPFEEYTDAGKWPVVKPGDEVEITGSVLEATQDPSLRGFPLNFCHARVVGSQAVPAPVTARLPDIVSGRHTFDLVQVKARLLNLQQMPADRISWRTTMMLEAGGMQLPLTHLDTGFTSFDTVRVDDELLITALVDDATATDPRQLWLISPGDVKSLGVSPVVRTRQLWLWGGGASAVLALLAGWIMLLRRSNRVQSRAAMLLEQKVTERTAELSQAQSDLQRALVHERELGELKSRFVTLVSHEFRTPLGIIMSAVELMRNYADRLPKDQIAELQNDIFSATRHMAGLMEQVLVLGRVEAGKLGCKRAPCALDVLASKLTDESLSATHRKCPVLWLPGGDLSGAHADEALLRHIFSNLLTNAVKYSPEGSEVHFTARREGPDALFEVIDQGIGIPENERDRLFEAFHRCSNVAETPGTGLGLVIVKRCVDLHGGSLHIDSAVGKGTTFTVRLPLFAHEIASLHG